MQTAESNVLEVSLPSFVSKEDARALLAVKLFETGRLSAGQAAAVAGTSRRAFLELLASSGISPANYPAGQLAGELEW